MQFPKPYWIENIFRIVFLQADETRLPSDSVGYGVHRRQFPEAKDTTDWKLNK